MTNGVLPSARHWQQWYAAPACLSKARTGRTHPSKATRLAPFPPDATAGGSTAPLFREGGALSYWRTDCRLLGDRAFGANAPRRR
jgi:hypothetical protein